MRGLPLTLLAVVLAGCSFGGGSSERESTGSDGFTRYELSAGQFSIAVPQTWHATTSRQMQKAGFKQLARENPAFRPYAEAAAKKRSPLKFFAYDPVVRKRFATNLNVVVFPKEKAMTPERFRRGAIAGAKSIAVSKVDASDVALSAGKAVRLQYRARFVLQGKKKIVSTLQYALLLNGRSYVLTYTTLPSFEKEFEYAFRRSASSFRLTTS